jgi:hypothetical protein
MTLRYVLDLHQCPSKNVNLFCIISSFGPRKVARDIDSGRKLVYTWAYIHQS